MPDFRADRAEIRAQDWLVADRPGRPQRPTRRDHRPRRAQDDDQRAQLRRAGLHGRPRGRPLADVGERGRRPGRAAGRRPARARVHVARRARPTGSTRRRRRCSCGPRGWHLAEAHVLVDGAPMSASLSTSGCTSSTTPPSCCARGSGPYFYLPKLEASEEARLWNDVFIAAQDALDIPRGTIRATVLIETILAAFEMDEILYELRDHAAGLNAGRWDYLFSCIKKFRSRPDLALPDRAQLTMTTPFMRAYTELLVKTCHRRGAHAIGGMAAFIPSRRDRASTRSRWRKVGDDKQRESGDGFDGTWVAHPDLVPAGDARSSTRCSGSSRTRRNACARRSTSLPRTARPHVRAAGSRRPASAANIAVALQYLDAWLGGNGAAAINNLMEDAATAEISRSQLWQWRTRGRLGRSVFDDQRYREIRDEEVARLCRGATATSMTPPRSSTASSSRRLRRVPDAGRVPAPRPGIARAMAASPLPGPPRSSMRSRRTCGCHSPRRRTCRGCSLPTTATCDGR